MKFIVIITTILLYMISSTPAVSDTEITVQSSQPDAPSSLYVSNGKVYTAAEGHKLVIDPNQETITIINSESKEYMLLDEAFIEEIGGMMSMMQDMMSQLPPGMLDQLPPEQREMILAQLGGDSKKQNTKKAKAVINKTGSSKKVSGIACDLYTIDDVDAGQTKACVASRAAAKMNADDYNTLMKVSDFGMTFVEKISASMPDLTDDIDISAMGNFDLPGVPMEVISDDITTVITSITEKSIDVSDYDISKYKQIDMSQMMGQ